MFDALVRDLSERYGLGDRSHELFGLLVAYIFNDRRGGFPGFVEGFREQGHGDLVQAWIGAQDGQHTLNTGDVNMVFGQGLLSDWGNRLGVSRATVAAAIAGVLPRLVAALTTGGRIPGNASMDPSLGATSATVPAPPPSLRRPEPEPPKPAGPADDVEPAFIEPGPAAADEPGFIVPGEEARAIDPAVRTPVAARHAQQARAAAATDPTEQRIADMMAAMGGEKGDQWGSRRRAKNDRPDNWRPAVHRPVRKRRSLGWLWFLLLLLAIAAGVAYAWQLGTLDPLIEQLNPHLREFGVWLPTRQAGG